MYLRINNNKTIWTKMEDLKNIKLDVLPVFEDTYIYENQNKNIWW